MVGAKNDYLPSNCSHQTSDALKVKLQNLLQKYLFWKLKRDLPKRTEPSISYIRVIITPQQLPGRRLMGIDNQLDKSLLLTYCKLLRHILQILHSNFGVKLCGLQNQLY